MKRFLGYLTMTLLSTLAACGLYSVKANSKELDGIPFLQVETIKARRETYAETWTELTLKQTYRLPAANASNPSPEKFTTKLTLWIADPTISSLINARFALGAVAGIDNNPVLKYFAQCAAATEIEKKALKLDIPADTLSCRPPENRKGKEIIALKRVGIEVLRTQRPASETSYININRPLIGETGATIQLNANGTLASAAGSVKDTTLESFLNFAPLGEFVSSRIKKPEKVSDVETQTASIKPVLVEIELSSDLVRRLYLLQTEKSNQPLDPEDGETTLTIQEQRASEKIPTPKPDEKNIEIQGTIKLPKDDKK